VGRVVGPVEVQQDGAGMLAAALLQVDRHQRLGHRCHRVAVRGLLQAGERRLAGEIPALVGRAPARPLQQRVGAQGVGVILVGIAAGDLEDALADEGGQAVGDRPAAPLRNAGGQGAAEPERLIGLHQPGEAAVAGQAAGIERRGDRLVRGADELRDGLGRLRHGTPPGGEDLITHHIPEGVPLSPYSGE
jgi:hypothetical protein